IDIAWTQFFNQETATLYYEAIRILSNYQPDPKTLQTPAQRIIQVATEAKTDLDLALLKEPDQGLVLLRLIQVEMLLGLKEPLADHSKRALDLIYPSKELHVFQARFFFNGAQEDDA